MAKCPIKIIDQANLVRALVSESWDHPQELMQTSGCGMEESNIHRPSPPKAGDGSSGDPAPTLRLTEGGNEPSTF